MWFMKLYKSVRKTIKAVKKVAKYILRGTSLLEHADNVYQRRTQMPPRSYNPGDSRQVIAEFVRLLEDFTTLIRRRDMRDVNNAAAQTDLFELIPGGATT